MQINLSCVELFSKYNQKMEQLHNTKIHCGSHVLHKLRHFCSAFSRRHVLQHLGTKCHGASHIGKSKTVSIKPYKLIKQQKRKKLTKERLDLQPSTHSRVGD